jgi:hypothetical protein
VGSELDYFIAVTSKNAGGSSAVRLDLTLPAGYTLRSSTADRGPGCTGAAPNLSCAVAFINPTTSTHVTLFGTVAQPGELDLTATVKSLAEPEFDAKDNTVTLKLVPVTTTGGGNEGGGGASAPKAVAAPTVSGKAAPGGTLHASAAKWSSTPSKVVYQWQLCKATGCTAIKGATKTTLKVAKSYAGRRVRVVATATIQGTSVKSTSRMVAIRKH